MVEITGRAKDRLLELRVSAGIAPLPEAGLRIAPDPNGKLELFADTERVGDHVVEHNGAKLLLIDEDLSLVLAGAIIDCRMTSQGPKLIVNRAGSQN